MLEQLITQLIAAIEANTAAQTGKAIASPPDDINTEEINDKPVKPVKPVKPAPAPEADDLAVDAEPATDPDQEKRDNLLELMKAVIAKNRDTAKKILAKFSSKTVSEIPSENLYEAIKLATKYGK